MTKFDIKLLSKEQKNNRKRIIEVSHGRSLSHLGSCLSAVDIIDAVYSIRKPKDRFILSNGHAGIALYIILKKNKLLKDVHLKGLNIHPDRDHKLSIDVSTGSLGQGLPIALGMAIANKKKNVYCMISDGECAEGSIWEALRIAYDKKVNNLKIILNANGWGAYDPIDLKMLQRRIEGFGYKVIVINGHNMEQLLKALKSPNTKPTLVFAKTEIEQLPFLKGQDAHYYTMTELDYRDAINSLS